MKNMIFNGDKVIFLPLVGATVIPLVQGTMKGTGKPSFGIKKVCIEGDEKKVRVPCTYTTPDCPNPGTGFLTIDKLNGNQLTTISKAGNKRIIRNGTFFTSKFQADLKASNPAAGTTDQVGSFSGKGQIVPSTTKIEVD